MVKVLFQALLATIFFTSVGCAKNRDANLSGTDGKESVPPISAPEKKPLIGAVPKICSALDFSGVTWPDAYTMMDQMAFSLAINITGSFEGHAGWTNLSNNFDGQGFSMGILNQNLGQGTIQPLFIKMRDQHIDVLQKYLKKEMLDSLLKMVSDWEKAQPKVDPDLRTQSLLSFDREPIDLFDENIDKKYAVSGIQLRSNSKSVTWAKNTLYTDKKGRNFKPEWKEALKNIAGDPAYISLQIAEAQTLHDQARGDQDRVSWEQLRSYLFLFDIVVQNGGLRDKHFDKFDDWYKKQTRVVTEEEQMLQMLEIRVVDSHPKWQKDVRRRKTTVIIGTGYVHGEDRNLPVEYCYDPMIPYLF